MPTSSIRRAPSRRRSRTTLRAGVPGRVHARSVARRARHRLDPRLAAASRRGADRADRGAARRPICACSATRRARTPRRRATSISASSRSRPASRGSRAGHWANPYVGARFGLAAVTTTLELAPDAPLAAAFVRHRAPLARARVVARQGHVAKRLQPRAVPGPRVPPGRVPVREAEARRCSRPRSSTRPACRASRSAPTSSRARCSATWARTCRRRRRAACTC